VHRLLAALIALSLVSLQAQSLAFHTHAVADEHDARDADHHDHRGPELHQHVGSETDRHVDEADVASDVVTVAVPAATVFTQLVLHIESAGVLIGAPREDAGRAPSVAARSHDPPAHSQPRFRGPPTSIQS
jgi:hypothetical protein